MSDRERWTIYPLLFLALALGLRDKLFPPEPPAPPTTLTLRQLSIVGSDNRPNILLTGSDKKETSAAIQILNPEGKPGWFAAVDPKTGASVEQAGNIYARDIRVVGADGKPRVAIVVGPGPEESGVIEWFAINQKRLLVAGGSAGDSGALTSFRDNFEQFTFGSNDRGTFVVVRGPEGKPYFLLTCDENGTGRGLLFDNQGKGQLLLGEPVDITLEQIHHEAPPRQAPDQPPAADAPPADTKAPSETQQKSPEPAKDAGAEPEGTSPKPQSP